MSCTPQVLLPLLLVAMGLILHIFGALTMSWSILEISVKSKNKAFMPNFIKALVNIINDSIDMKLRITFGPWRFCACVTFSFTEWFCSENDLVDIKDKIDKYPGLFDFVKDVLQQLKVIDWFVAVLAVTLIGALTAAVGVLLGLMAFLNCCSQEFPKKTLNMASLISAFAALFMFTGVFIWSIKLHPSDEFVFPGVGLLIVDIKPIVESARLGYSFYLSCAGAVLTGVGSIAYFIVALKMPDERLPGAFRPGMTHPVTHQPTKPAQPPFAAAPGPTVNLDDRVAHTATSETVL